MPVNKAAYIRHEIIDECLRNTMRKWNKNAILKCVNTKLKEKFGASNGQISEATLRNDLKDMEVEYGAPIVRYKHERSFCYRYEIKDYSIKNLPVNSEDLSKLNLAVHILQQIHGFVLADEIAEVVQKLEQKAKLASSSRPAIAFDNRPVAQGVENLGDIYQAILNKNVLKISYRHFKAAEAYDTVVHPYYLKEFNNRWFLFAWSDHNQRVDILALDRMKSIKVVNIPYRENSFDPDGYFAHIIGVTDPGTPVEDIQLCFCKERAPYINTRKIHSSQKEQMLEDGSMLVNLNLKINHEFVALLLGFADHVEVLAPESLRMKIRERHLKAVDNYMAVLTV